VLDKDIYSFSIAQILTWGTNQKEEVWMKRILKGQEKGEGGAPLLRNNTNDWKSTCIERC